MDIEALKYGEAVHDMHDGPPNVEALFGKGYKIKAHVRISMAGGADVIRAMLAKRPADRVRQALYTNKMLVFVGEHFNGVFTAFQFAYSYDNILFGLIAVEEVVGPEEPA